MVRPQSARVAALYDIHGNLPALRAVLTEVAGAGADTIVLGGDVVTGPLPSETATVLVDLAAAGRHVHCVGGNADREAVEAFDAGRMDPSAESEVAWQEAAFTAARLSRSTRDWLARFASAVTLQVTGIGAVLFCHASPRSDSENITTATSAARLASVLAAVPDGTMVVGGHTHRQFSRSLQSGGRYLNAGSVGRPYEGRPGAFWALLSADGVELRRTEYDVPAAAAVLSASAFPGIADFLAESLLAPADPDEVATLFERLATD